MKSYRTLAIKELLSQKVTSILILLAVILSTMMTTIVGQSIGALAAMREQQAIMIGGKRYATFLQIPVLQYKIQKRPCYQQDQCRNNCYL